jgi:hypothetical protein
MSSPVVPGEANRAVSADRTTEMYWLSGLAPVLTNLVTPLFVYYKMRNNPSEMVKYNQQVNEVGRQFISGTIGLLAYFGGGELTRGALNALGWGTGGGKVNESDQQMGMMLGGTVMNFLGYAILRPMISTPFICKFLKPEGNDVSLTPEQIFAVMEKDRKQKVKIKNLADMRALVDAEIVALAKKAPGAPQAENFLIRPVQKWVDGHLFDKLGKPLIGKAVGVSTAALAVWLTGVTAILYALNRALGAPKVVKPSVTPVLPFPQWRPMPGSAPMAGNQSPFPANAMGQRRYSSGGFYPPVPISSFGPLYHS